MLTTNGAKNYPDAVKWFIIEINNRLLRDTLSGNSLAPHYALAWWREWYGALFQKFTKPYSLTRLILESAEQGFKRHINLWEHLSLRCRQYLRINEAREDGRPRIQANRAASSSEVTSDHYVLALCWSPSAGVRREERGYGSPPSLPSWTWTSEAASLCMAASYVNGVWAGVIFR